MIFEVIAFLVLLAVLAVVVFLGIVLARKAGLLPEKEELENHKLKKFLKPSELKQSLIFRFALIGLLVLLMSLPLESVKQIVAERHLQYQSVLSSIAKTWGDQQTLAGPALLIPYTEKHLTEETVTNNDGTNRKVNKVNYSHHTAIVLPESLSINTNLQEKRRKRSIYESLVYTADLKINGHFTRPVIEELSKDLHEIHWEKAWLSLGMSDTKAINQVSKLSWNNKPISFEPGTRVTSLVKNGFHAPIQLKPDKQNYAFSLALNINGSNGFYFKPFGKTTQVNIQSNWPHPSFAGDVLPQHREINNEGFTAEWSIPHLARNYPQLWTLDKQQYDLNEFTSGVNLFEPVTLYSQITRAIKYGILFIALTYITFLIFELGIKRRLHPVQYTMIGLAMSLFYLTLLSLAEHIMFLPAYVTSAAIIVVMISLYVYAALHNIFRAGMIALLLTGLYGILYTLLNLEDFSLLVGTGLLLIVLAVLMYLTRNTGKQAPEDTA
jgi:inner membrane protein